MEFEIIDVRPVLKNDCGIIVKKHFIFTIYKHFSGLIFIIVYSLKRRILKFCTGRDVWLLRPWPPGIPSRRHETISDEKHSYYGVMDVSKKKKN